MFPDFFFALFMSDLFCNNTKQEIAFKALEVLPSDCLGPSGFMVYACLQEAFNAPQGGS